jgi:orotate phosphoribosyltransferase
MLRSDAPSFVAATRYYFRPRRLSDVHLESCYSDVSEAFSGASEIVLDFRRTTWFDLWALIQLLFFLRERQIDQKWSVMLLSPRGLPKSTTAESRRHTLDALQFLSNIGFLKEVHDLGCELQLQQSVSLDSLTPTSPEDIRQLLAAETDAGPEAGDGRAILPITHVSDLDLKVIGDQLYSAADRIFGQFRAESIVHKGGIGDCLLTELVNNAKFHGGANAYVALRAVPGLRRVRRNNLKDYRRLRKIRAQHPLGDWRAYFDVNPDDPYFELVVADRGEGIASTITEDERLPADLRDAPASDIRTHRLVSYALQSESSRLSSRERRQRGLTDFTGLAAVRFVLGENHGTLFVREPRTRHYIGEGGPPEGLLVSEMALRPLTRKLPHIQGTSLSAVVPIRSARAEAVGIPLSTLAAGRDLSGYQEIPARVLRIIDPETESITFLDGVDGMDWRTAFSATNKLKGTGTLVLIDLAHSPITKDTLWAGLRRLIKLANRCRLPVALVGVTPRLASRLEEFVSLDARGGPAGEWLVLGLGDDWIGYAFGRYGRSAEERRRGIEGSVVAFAKGDRPPGGALAPLLATQSVRWDADSGMALAQPRWTFPQVRAVVVSHYDSLLALGLKESQAWLPGTSTRLPNGDVVRDYFCIHSMAQQRSLHEDFARIACLLGAAFQFDGILALGASSHEAAARLARRLSASRFRRGQPALRVHSAQDSFALDHGEGGGQPLGASASSLVLLDAVRTGHQAAEAISHIQDSGGHVAAVIALLDFRNGVRTQLIDGVPLMSAVNIPLERLDPTSTPDFQESPYSGALEVYAGGSTSESQASLNRRQAYQYLEGHGLIASGHLTFYDQHFARTVPLAYILSSSIGLKADIVHSARNLIADERIDCLLLPEHSSIRFLADSLLNSRNDGSPLHAVVCRRTFWPDQLAGYEIDVAGRVMLRNARRVAILEDETYTGSSIKDLLSITLEHCPTIGRIVVFSVVDSMRRTERRLLSSVLRRGLSAGETRPTITVLSTSFMRLALCSYWSQSNCPLCRTLRMLGRPEFVRLGFLEERYAQRRSQDLKRRQVDQDYQARRSLTTLSSTITVSRPGDPTDVRLATREGLELYCEEAYVDGDILWLLERCHRSHSQHFAQSALLTVLDLLSRDFALLGRVQARTVFLDRVEALLVAQVFTGPALGRMMEMLLGWPLHCLRQVWVALLESLFRQTLDEFTDCLPAMELLLEEIEQRPAHAIRERLLQQFEARLVQFVGAAPANDTEWRTRALFTMCLQRGVDRLRPTYRQFGELLVDAHLLTAYFAPDRPSHQVLKSGLAALSASDPAVPASKYMYVVQMLDHLRHSLHGLKRFDFGVTDWSNTDGYERFDQLVSQLHGGYPHHGNLANGTAGVGELAGEIGDLLYRDSTAGAFRERLEKYLGARRLSLEAFLQPLLTANIADAEMVFTETRAEARSDRIFIPLDDEAHKGVLSDFVENMKKAAALWLQAQPRPSTLFSAVPSFRILVEYDATQRTVLLSIRNPRLAGTPQQGVGLGQIETFLARFGHEYKIRVVDSLGQETIVHDFRLRRIYP